MNLRSLRYFLALFLPSAALVAAAAVLVHRAETSRQIEAIELHERLESQRGARDLSEFVAARARDVRFIRALPSMRSALEDVSPATARNLEALFAVAIATRRDIDRIRWIDETGVEQVRVSATPTGTTFAAAAELADKHDRYFVRDIERLGVDQVFVSPMDLSVDRGTIERPLKPVVRLGTPLVDLATRRRGMLVVNYRVEGLLKAFHANTRGMYGHAMLLDGAGRWLHAQRAGLDPWAAMLGQRETFAASESAAWSRISAAASGQFTDASGIWTFETVQPLAVAAVGAGTRPVSAADTASTVAHDWKIVSFVPASRVRAAIGPVTQVVAAGAGILLVLGAVFGAMISRAWVRRETAELERVGQEARENEAALRLVLQSNPNAMMVIDRSGAVFEANPRAEQVFGYSREELLRLQVEDFVPLAARASHVRLRESYGGETQGRPMGQGMELRARRHDGSEFPVEISLAPLTLSGRAFVVATVVDISARKQAELQVRELNATLERRVEQRTEALQRAESHLRLILESNASGLFGVDPRGRITFANPAARRMLGFERGELVGRQASSLEVHGGPGRGLAARLEQTLRRGTDASVDDEAFRHASGGDVPVMYATHPMIRGGRIVGAVVSFVDATERRALDVARESALHEAERLAQARSDFLANMSHEIRTPLNGVLGLAQVAHRDGSTDPATRATFARILDAGRTLLAVVDNVLDFSRIEAGKVQLEAIPADLATLVEEVMVSIRPVAEAKGLAVRVERQAGAPDRCVTDPTRVRQVLLNLLANAVKFTERGEVVLRIEREAAQLRFIVRDTGIGITAEQAERIFTAFEQADMSTTRRFGGTGLGLAICKRIVELMGGQISVRSEPGAGSEFTVLLPYVELTQAEGLGLDATKKDAPVPRTDARLEGVRLLLAEDNEVNQLVVQAMLRKEGPQIVTVGDGLQAVERVRREGPGAFDIVLMDIQMPRMDGYEATRLVHEIDPGLPVVGQTAHVLHEAIEQSRAAGMVAHLSKPIDRHELVALVMRHARPRDADQLAAGNNALSA